MLNIYYKSSEGVIVDLIHAPYRMLTETELLNNSWEWETIGTNFPRIAKLKKTLVSPAFSIRVIGTTKEQMMDNLEHLISVFDRDCFLETPGRLYIGEFYRDCFITSSSKQKVFERNATTVQFTATSDNPYWCSESEAVFSGSGSRGNEIAGSCLASASVNEATMTQSKLANGKMHLEWSQGRLSTDGDWIKFDIGSVIDVEEFSGIYLTRTSNTPVSIDLQTSVGTTQDVPLTKTLTTLTESGTMRVDDFTEIKIDSCGGQYWFNNHTLDMYCYQAGQMVNTISINDLVHQWIDVSEYDRLSFFASGSGQIEISMEYRINQEQWTTIDTIEPALNETIEAVATDINCRYIRLRGQYFGSDINADVSIYSGEVAPDRDMFMLQYELDNISNYTVRDDDSGLRGIELSDQTKPGYIIFSDQGTDAVVLKNIYCEYVRSGTAIVQGRSGDTWTDIITLEDSTDQDYNNNYDQLRIKFTEDTILQYCHIYAQTDARIYNKSYAPSDAVIEITGPANDPSVLIGGIEYGADTNLQAGHRLVIDTKKKTVRDYSSDQVYENIFASRLPDAFTKIETGENAVEWIGSANQIKIILEQSRSEPKWN